MVSESTAGDLSTLGIGNPQVRRPESDPPASTQKPAPSVFDDDRRYLVGVQGLRTVAALLVVVYHIWFRRVSGGVDVFFVVAGFFSMGSLLRAYARANGGKQIASATFNYLLRTARRVIPSAALVISVSAGAALLWMPKLFWATNIQSGWASLTFRENWRLISQSTDYLAQGTASTLFQQFWALSVNVQYYILAAIVLGIVSACILRWSKRGAEALPRAFAWVTVLVLLASFTYSVVATHSNQSAAYFDTWARLWEFMFGALLFLVLRKTPDPSPRRAAQFRILSWGGLVGLLLLGAVVDLGSRLPGYWSLLPVAAAMSLIVGSWNRAEPSILKWKPVLYVANASFAIYLWHWPMLVFYRILVGPDVSILWGLGIIGASVGLAILTTKFVENPIRFSKAIGAYWWRTVLTCLLLVLPPAALLHVWDAKEVSSAKEAEIAMERLEPASVDSNSITPNPNYPNTQKHMAFSKECIQAVVRPEVVECRWTEEADGKSVYVVGGSRTAQWLDVLVDSAEELDADIYTLVKSSCPFGDTEGFGYTPLPSCVEWNLEVMEMLLEQRPDVVVTNGTRWIEGVNVIPSGYNSAFEKLLAAGIGVVAIEDNPLFPYDVPECVAARGADACFQDFDKYYSKNEALSPISDPHFRFVAMADQYCPEGTCVSVDEGVLVYQDSHHLTTLWTRVHGQPLIDAVASVLALDAGSEE